MNMETEKCRQYRAERKFAYEIRAVLHRLEGSMTGVDAGALRFARLAVETTPTERLAGVLALSRVGSELRA